MYFIYAGIIIGLLITCVPFLFSAEARKELGLVFPLGIAGALVGGVIGLFVAMFAGPFLVDPPADAEHSYLLKTINDGKSGTSGSFFLGIGSFDGGDPEYAYYRQVGPGQYVLETVNAWNATVVEGGDSEPHVVVRDMEGMADWGYWTNPSEYKYTFWVPENSITNSYELDAE